MKQKIIAAGGLVFDDEKRLLMIYRRGFWDLPKGKLDKGETVETCAVREVQEETGLKDIALKKIIGVTYHDYFDKWRNGEVTKETHWFEMEAKGKQKLIPQTEEDITEIKWIDKNDLNKYFKKSYKNIEDIVKKYFSAE